MTRDTSKAAITHWFRDLSTCLTALNKTYPPEDPPPGVLPRFLFRGERCGWPRTLSFLDRQYGGHPVYQPNTLATELAEVLGFLMRQGGFPPQLAGAYGQHYGFATDLFDFTSNLYVAGYFALQDNTPTRLREPDDEVGFIMVMHVATAIERKLATIRDIRSHPFAARARRQSAYAVIVPGELIMNDVYGESFVDLKAPEISESVGLELFVFDHTADEAQCVEQKVDTRALLEPDPIAQSIVDRFVAQYGKLSQPTASFLARYIPPFQRTEQQNVSLWT